MSSTPAGLRSRMRLLGGVVAGIAAGGGIALLINRSIAAANSIGKLSGAIGVGTATLQELRYAAGLAGVSTGQLDGAMVAFSKRVGEARSGTGTLITLLKKMDPALLANVQAARTVDEAFDIIIRRAFALGNTLDRNALLAAFGRTVGPLMANFIRDGVEWLDRLRRSDRAGGALTLAACWVHARRGLKEVFDSNGSPIAAGGLERIAALYAVEKEARGQPPGAHSRSHTFAQSRMLAKAVLAGCLLSLLSLRETSSCRSCGFRGREAREWGQAVGNAPALSTVCLHGPQGACRSEGLVHKSIGTLGFMRRFTAPIRV